MTSPGAWRETKIWSEICFSTSSRSHLRRLTSVLKSSALWGGGHICASSTFGDSRNAHVHAAHASSIQEPIHQSQVPIICALLVLPHRRLRLSVNEAKVQHRIQTKVTWGFKKRKRGTEICHFVKTHEIWGFKQIQELFICPQWL